MHNKTKTFIPNKDYESEHIVQMFTHEQEQTTMCATISYLCITTKL